MKHVVVLGIAFEVEADDREQAEAKAFAALQEHTRATVTDGFWVEDTRELQGS
jgi:hypothetical protein